MRTFVVILAAAIAMFSPASAATTVYAGAVYAQGGSTANLGNGLGAPNGAAARIGNGFTFFGIPIGQAGQVTYSFASALSGAGLQFSALASTGAPQVFVSIGEIVSGVATYSTETSFAAGSAGLFSLDLSAACSSISSTGCSLIRIRNAGGIGGGAFLLDGVSGVAAAPEPAAWALMLIGFLGVAARMKTMRKRRYSPALAVA